MLVSALLRAVRERLDVDAEDVRDLLLGALNPDHPDHLIPLGIG